jgi:hypothetical protein
MYLFTDLALAFRRVTFASIFFWFTALILMFLSLSRLRESYFRSLQLCFATLAFCMLLVVGWVMDTGTQQVAAREWFAATCAAKSVTLTGPKVINRPSALEAIPMAFPRFFNNDELQVKTLSFPSGGMMIWLSQKEANTTSKNLPSPWAITFSEDPPLSDWDVAFAKCASEYENRSAISE